MFPRLETERLVLREIQEGDAKAVLEIFGSDAVTRYYDLATMTNIQQARELISRMRQRNEQEDTLRWGIALKDGGAVIGTGGFNQFRRGWFSGSIGYELAPPYWNRGYMTEALHAIVRHGFAELNLNRIEAMVMLGNDASVRVLEKVGFQHEGILREYGFWKNTFWDLRLFALLKREWNGKGLRGGNQ